jgi:cysteinyl-tRNA synthetase
LQQAKQSLDRLRNFHYRLTHDKFATGQNPDMHTRARAAREAFEAGLDDNLNTAQALAAIFELVREANITMDNGHFRQGDVPPLSDVLARWDRIFAMLVDRDRERLAKVGLLMGAEQKEASQQVDPFAAYTDARIEQLVAERNAARRGGDFARADQIRSELSQAGVILEDTKAGTRWKRK